MVKKEEVVRKWERRKAFIVRDTEGGDCALAQSTNFWT